MNIKPYAHALILLAVFFAALSAYGAWYAKVGKESANVISLQNQLQANAQNATRAKAAKNELEHALADEASIKGYFVHTSEIVPFLESIQKVGNTFGTKVEVVSVSAEPSKPHAVLLLSLRITGPFAAVERTLGAIEYEPYDTVVSNVTIDTTGPLVSGVPQWTAAATLRIGTIDTPVETNVSTQDIPKSETATTTP